ncbi:unnamed protein product [Cylicocyclus nassatus]|uniref:Uncharacterized protein n=1 Tax=Cylicocyclus nassatus TaxID=53992 RepID=A0AA36DM48_CYLNA|nr:unnamed protein product [Cylicocyclus nassatus]
MAYVSVHHYLPKDRQKKRKKILPQTYEDPCSSVLCMRSFRNEPIASLAWLFEKTGKGTIEQVKAEPTKSKLAIKSRSRSQKTMPPPVSRNYENTVDQPRYFEPEIFKDAAMPVCYVYVNLELKLVLAESELKLGFSIISIAENIEVNGVTAGELQ